MFYTIFRKNNKYKQLKDSLAPYTLIFAIFETNA